MNERQRRPVPELNRVDKVATADWSDDAFWQAMEPALCAPERLALAEGDVADIVSGLDLRRGACVLDLACRPGAHAQAFAARGYVVTGVDRTARLLNRARNSAQERRATVEYVQADMREFVRPGGFDLVCSLYTSFGYFDNGGNRRVLENVLTSLKPGGSMLLDVSGRETVARHWRDGSSLEAAGTRYEERRRIAEDWSLLLADWTVVRGEAREHFEVRQRLYAGTELRDLLAAVGFVDIRLSGSLDTRTPYDHTAKRLVAVARSREERR
jgi:SAM-dependent methyltransferase